MLCIQPNKKNCSWHSRYVLKLLIIVSRHTFCCGRHNNAGWLLCPARVVALNQELSDARCIVKQPDATTDPFLAHWTRVLQLFWQISYTHYTFKDHYKLSNSVLFMKDPTTRSYLSQLTSHAWPVGTGVMFVAAHAGCAAWSTDSLDQRPPASVLLSPK